MQNDNVKFKILDSRFRGNDKEGTGITLLSVTLAKAVVQILNF